MMMMTMTMPTNPQAFAEKTTKGLSKMLNKSRTTLSRQASLRRASKKENKNPSSSREASEPPVEEEEELSGATKSLPSSQEQLLYKDIEAPIEEDEDEEMPSLDDA